MQKSKLFVILAMLTSAVLIATLSTQQVTSSEAALQRYRNQQQIEATLSTQQVTSSEAEPDVEVVATAKASYMAFQATYQTGRASAEDLYRWSVRWMDAEGRSKPARVKHLERMESLRRGVSAKHADEIEGGDDASYKASAFYVAEAKSMLK
jgi:hypothetical protein